MRKNYNTGHKGIYKEGGGLFYTPYPFLKFIGKYFFVRKFGYVKNYSYLCKIIVELGIVSPRRSQSFPVLSTAGIGSEVGLVGLNKTEVVPNIYETVYK